MNYADKIYDIMRDANLHGEVWHENDHAVAVEINWGDWKHEHARLDWLVREKLPELKSVTEETTEENGSDCYSAIHHFTF